MVKKSPELLPESLNLNGNILFDLLFTELDEQIASVSYRKTRNKNGAEEQNKQIILHCMTFNTKTKTA